MTSPGSQGRRWLSPASGSRNRRRSPRPSCAYRHEYASRFPEPWQTGQIIVPLTSVVPRQARQTLPDSAIPLPLHAGQGTEAAMLPVPRQRVQSSVLFIYLSPASRLSAPPLPALSSNAALSPNEWCEDSRWMIKAFWMPTDAVPMKRYLITPTQHAPVRPLAPSISTRAASSALHSTLPMTVARLSRQTRAVGPQVPQVRPLRGTRCARP